jgi:hypothetical protein
MVIVSTYLGLLFDLTFPRADAAVAWGRFELSTKSRPSFPGLQ